MTDRGARADVVRASLAVRFEIETRLRPKVRVSRLAESVTSVHQPIFLSPNLSRGICGGVRRGRQQRELLSFAGRLFMGGGVEHGKAMVVNMILLRHLKALPSLGQRGTYASQGGLMHELVSSSV